MQIYGKQLTWGTASFPKIFTGITDDYSYKEIQRQSEIEGEEFNIAALVLDQLKGEISFGATVTSGSTNFLNLAIGAKIAVESITTGVILCSEAVEKWTLGKEKTANIKANHYPHMTDTTGASAGLLLSAYTPTSELTEGVMVVPTGKVRWGTSGLSVTYGTVADLSLAQKLTLAEEVDESSQITTVISGKYMRTIDLTVAAIGERPSSGTILEIEGAPSHASGYKIISSEVVGKKGAKKAYQLSAIWLPCFDDAA